MQPNGYKPAPLDLSSITLNQKLEELVDQLAENTHNIWAKERVSEGWTYGLNEVILIFTWTTIANFRILKRKVNRKG